MEHVEIPVWRADLSVDEATDQLGRSLSRWIGSTALARLAEAWGGRPPVSANAGERFNWFEEFSARHWDFRAGGERNLATRPELDPAQEKQALATADALGMVHAAEPRHQVYDTVLVLGGLIRACFTRPKYAAELVDRGYEFGEVVALGGFRDLKGDELVLADALNAEVSNELEAMVDGVGRAFPTRAIGEVETSDPPGTGNADWAVTRFTGNPPLSVVAAPSSEPATRRANTVDTFDWWAARHGGITGARILLVTATIYLPYQAAGAIRMLALPHQATVETVGISPKAADLGRYTQSFGPDNYLQETRSAIRGLRDLYHNVIG